MTTPNLDCHHPRANHQHGTSACYVLDRCRCTPCRTASSADDLARRRLQAYGRYDALVDAEPIRNHIRALTAAGMGIKSIQRASGINGGTMWAILYGKYPDRPDHPDHCPPRRRVSKRVAEQLLAVQLQLADGARVDPTGTRRRLQALVTRGWTLTSLATRLGMNTSNFGRVIHPTGGDVSHHTATRVRDLYDTPWDATPPAGTSTDRARRYAERRNWAPPLAWDDDTIDDPAATPDRGAPVRPGRGQPVEHLIEDVQWLADEGLTLQGVADRLGRKPKDLAAQLHRAKRADLAAQLLRNDRSRRAVA